MPCADSPRVLPDSDPPATSWTTVWADLAACDRAGAALAGVIAAAGARGGIVELVGPLGAGKSTFARAVLRALGVTGTIRSPTYTLVEPYEEARLPAWHFDFYRFADPEEWDLAGLRDIFARAGLKLVEWPEHARGRMPSADLTLTLTPDAADPERRAVACMAGSATGSVWLRDWRALTPAT